MPLVANVCMTIPLSERKGKGKPSASHICLYSFIILECIGIHRMILWSASHLGNYTNYIEEKSWGKWLTEGK